MAIGAARLFGIRLPLNFHSPYQATNIIEFWRRWHMTLSRFLRDYLYIPFGGNRKGKSRRYINLMLTMTIGGLWHGAWWNFALWGFLHGLYLVVNHGWQSVWTPINRWWSRSVARVVTLIAVIAAFVAFRAPNLPAAFRLYRSMVGLPQDAASPLAASAAAAPSGDWPASYVIMLGLLALVVLWFLPNTQQLMARYQPAFNFDLEAWRRDPPLSDALLRIRPLLCWRLGFLAAAFVGFLGGLALLDLQHVSEFLYFEF